MCALFLRQDDVELSGKILSSVPMVDLNQSNGWMLTVELDPGQEQFLTHRSGSVNAARLIRASLSLPENLPIQPNLFAITTALLGMQGQRARIVGSWVDNDLIAQTEIHPLVAVVVEHPLALYDINTWAVAVRDVDVFAFAHDPPVAFGDPPPLHAGESRTVHVTLSSPRRPTAMAKPFRRVYRGDRLDFAQSWSFTAPRALPSGDFAVDAEIVTGPPGAGQGFFYAHVGLTYDEDYLTDLCPLGRCEDEQHHCQTTGETRYSWVPPRIPEANIGHLALSPGDGKGMVSGIVAALTPNQVYDHMGIFLDNGWTIRHCTSSQERFEDENLWTGVIDVSLVFGAIHEVEKVPLNGLRPDHVRFGWPGSITQTVEEVYYTGRNTHNSAWSWATIHGTDSVDPDPDDPNVPGPFRIYHLEPGARGKRVAFVDPQSTNRADLMRRLQDAPVTLMLGDPATPTPLFPTLIRPHAALAALAEPCPGYRLHLRVLVGVRADPRSTYTLP